MPSPAAHTVMGAAFAAAAFAPKAGSWRELFRGLLRQWRGAALCIVLANAPDVDYAFGIPEGDFNKYHQLYSHTFGWVFAAAAVAYLAWRHYNRGATWRFFLFLLAVACSHLLADVFTADASRPYGIMAAWPFYPRRLISPWSIFPRWAKDNWSSLASLKNLKPLLREMLVTLPLLALALACKRYSARIFTGPNSPDARLSASNGRTIRS